MFAGAPDDASLIERRMPALGQFSGGIRSPGLIARADEQLVDRHPPIARNDACHCVGDVVRPERLDASDLVWRRVPYAGGDMVGQFSLNGCRLDVLTRTRSG